MMNMINANSKKIWFRQKYVSWRIIVSISRLIIVTNLGQVYGATVTIFCEFAFHICVSLSHGRFNIQYHSANICSCAMHYIQYPHKNRPAHKWEEWRNKLRSHSKKKLDRLACPHARDDRPSNVSCYVWDSHMAIREIFFLIHASSHCKNHNSTHAVGIFCTVMDMMNCNKITPTS